MDKQEEQAIIDRINELERQAEQAEEQAQQARELEAKYTSQPPPGQDITQWLTEQKTVLPDVGKEAESAKAKAAFYRSQAQTERQALKVEQHKDEYNITSFQYTDKGGSEHTGEEAWEVYKKETTDTSEKVQAIASKELSPFITFGKEGSYYVDVYTALKAGVAPETLKKVGVTEAAIAEASKPGAKRLLTREEYEKDVAARHFIYTQAEKRLKKDHVKLPDGQWIKADALAEIKKSDPELYGRLTSGGYEAAQDYWDKNYVALPDGSTMSRQTLAFIRDMPGRGYEVLTSEGYDAYVDYNEDLLNRVKPFAVYDSKGKVEGYDLEDAMRAYDKNITEAVEVLFDPASVSHAKYLTNYENSMRIKEIGYEAWKKERDTQLEKLKGKIPQAPAKAEGKTKPVLPIWAAAAIPVVTATPGPLDDIAVWVLVGGLVASAGYTAYMNRENLAYVTDAVSNFRSQFGRNPTVKDIQLVDEAGKAATLSSIMDPTKPIAMEKVMPGKIQLFSHVPVDAIKAQTPPFPGVLLEPIKIPPSPGVALEPLKHPVYPGTLLEPTKYPPYPGELMEPLKVPALPTVGAAETPQTMVTAAVELAEAQDIIQKTVYPKIMTVKEMDRFLPSTIPQTSKALVALDAAVTDAHMRGELTDEEVSQYRAARKRYLARLNAINDAMKTYIGGMMPELKGDYLTEVSTAAAAAYLTAMTTKSKEAADIALETFIKSIQKGRTIEQATTFAQTATETETQTEAQEALEIKMSEATRTATRTATQTATQTEAEQATETETELSTRAAIAAQTAATTATRAAAKAAEAEAEATTTAEATLTAPLMLKLGKGEKLSDEEKRRIIKAAPGASCWPQGKLHGEVVWHTVLEPYSEATHLVVVGKQPEGAKYFPGPREAYKSFTQKGRPPAKPTKLEGGAVDPVISSKGIEFFKDPNIKRRAKAPNMKVREFPTGLASDVVVTKRGGRSRRHIRLT